MSLLRTIKFSLTTRELMAVQQRQILEFGPFRFDAPDGLLYEGEAAAPLTPKALQTLAVLLEKRGRLVEKAELLRRVWPGVYVEEATLAQNIFTLRKQLRDGQDGAVYIETIPRRGYRFAAPVIVRAQQGRPAADVAASPSLSNERVMLLVLPIDNMSADPELDYLSDGFTEAIICELGALHPQQLGVIARTSAMTYKGTRKTIREIATDLDVQYVLEGSLRCLEQHVVVTAHLIDARNQTPIWTKRFERPVGGMLRLQNEVAAAVATGVTQRLFTVPRALQAAADPLVYECYLRGRYHWNKRTDEGLRIAIHEFERAIEADPRFAPAHAGLAACWTFRSVYGAHRPRDTLPRAKAAALRALELDERSAEAHAALGMTLSWLDFAWSSAERELRRAVELEPNNPAAHQWYATYLALLLRVDEALEHVEIALRFDPLSASVRFVHALVLGLAGYDHSAIEAAQTALRHNPYYYLNRVMLGHCLVRIGRTAEGLEHLQTAYEHSGRQLDFLVHLGYGYAASGTRDRALEILHRVQSGAARASDYYLARLHASLGDDAAAIACLERAYEERAILVTGAASDRYLRSLHGAPRFAALLARMNLPISPPANDRAERSTPA